MNRPETRIVTHMALKGTYEPGTNDWAAQQVETYESSGGTEGTTLNGLPVVILTALGAKSGKIRKVPLMRVEHAGQYALIASKGGAPNHPSWYHNLVANPDVELQDGPERHEYTAREVAGPERETWWDRAVAAYPPYEEYAQETERAIPVFVLTRRS